jgi:HAD superfamily hydrolase (TIGR01509 family)
LKDEITTDPTGMGLRDFMELWKQHGLVGETDKLMTEFRDVFYDLFLKEKTILMPGAIELVRKARDGYRVALTTGGHSEEMVKKILENVNLIDCFEVIVSSDDVARGKPDPDVYLKALKELMLEANDCLALEDSVNGVLAAKAANIPVYGINPDEKVRSDLMKANADQVFISLSEVDL